MGLSYVLLFVWGFMFVEGVFYVFDCVERVEEGVFLCSVLFEEVVRGDVVLLEGVDLDCGGYCVFE